MRSAKERRPFSVATCINKTWIYNALLHLINFKGPSRLGEPGPRLQQMMDSGKFNASSAGESMGLNASIRERLRSKVRGRQVQLHSAQNTHFT